MAISSPYNDNKLTLTEAIALLDNEVGKFCHGRFVRLEPLTTDRKISEIREAPAAAIITGALRYLQVATLEANTLDLKRHLEQKWVRQATWCRWKSRL